MFKFLLTVLLLIGATLFCGQVSSIYHRYATQSLPPPDVKEPPLRALPNTLVRTLFPAAGVICILIFIVVAIFG
jgi:hypothetical protein